MREASQKLQKNYPRGAATMIAIDPVLNKQTTNYSIKIYIYIYIRMN